MSVISVTAFAQNSKIIVLINKASWCPVCKANEPRFIKEVLPNISNHSEAKIIFNDLSNHKTKEESKHEIEKEGLDQFIQKNKSCLLYTSPSPRDGLLSRMPSSA